MNTITIVGNLGKSPEMTEFASGTKLLKFSLAESQYRKDEAKDNQEPLWHECELWGDLADRFLKCNVPKGKQLVVTGMLQKNYYEKMIGDQKVQFRKVKVKVQSFQLVGKKEDGEPDIPEDDDDKSVAQIFDGKTNKGVRKRA
jgi:single-strand DNA-binding protein